MTKLKYIFKIFFLFSMFISAMQIAYSQESFCSTVATGNSVGELKSNTGQNLCNIIPPGPFYIKIYIHAVGRDDGSGAPTREQLEESLSYLDADFNPHNIFFIWDCDIIPINSTALFSYGFGNSACILSQYSNHSDGIDVFIGGDDAPEYAYAVDIPSKAFMVKGTWGLNPGGACPGTGEWVNSRSHIISHEMGHCLGLWHTHHGNIYLGYYTDCEGNLTNPPECQEFVDGTNSTICGDYVTDTPADPGLNPCFQHIYANCEFGWTRFDSNSDIYAPDETLIMSYSHDKCMVAHSKGQGDRMRCMINNTPILQATLVPAPAPPAIFTTQTITTNTSWTTTNLPNNGEILFDGTLTIQPGAKLNILPGVVVRFSTNSEVIVEPGAQLVMNSSTFTAQCGDTWKGIQVVGNSNQVQNLVTQGRVVLNGATIEHAARAIYVARKDPTGGYVSGTTGGVVQIINATFRDNARDVMFLPYVNRNNIAYSPEKSNISYFTLSKSYLTDNYRFNSANLYSFIFMSGVSGIRIEGHTFHDQRTMLSADRPSEKTGIFSYYSGFIVDQKCSGLSPHPLPPACNGTPTKFIDLDYGIIVNGYGNKSFNVSVKNSEFNTWHGIYMDDAYAPAIQLNDFYVKRATDPSIHSYGVYLDRSYYYSVENNDFESEVPFGHPNSGDGAIGVVVKNEHGQYKQIYRNNFDNFSVGVEAISQNRSDAPQDFATGLEFRCNDFSNSRGHDIFVTKDIANPDPTVPVGIKPIQNLPANLFSYAPQPVLEHIVNSAGIPNLTYIHHDETNDIRVKPNTTFGDVTVMSSGEIRGPDACPNNFGNDYLVDIDEGIIIFGDIKNTKHDMYVETLSKLSALVDDGNTPKLLQAVSQANRDDAFKLHDIILGQAPFTSDEVLEEVARNEGGFTNGMIRDILTAHPQAAKSAQIQQILDDRQNLLFPFMRHQINVGLNVISKKEQMELDAATHKRERDQAISQAIQLIALDTIDRSDDMIPFLSNTDDIGYEYHLAELYDKQGKTDLADKILMEISKQDLSPKEADDYTYFTKFRNLMHKWKQEGKNLTALKQSDLAELEDYAKKHNVTAGKAITLLKLNGNFDYKEPVYLPSEIAPDPRSDEEDGKNDEMLTKEKLSIYPNPVNNYFIVNYSIIQASKNISLLVTDINGKIMYNKTLDAQQDEIIIRTDEFPTGQYFCTLKTNNNTVKTQKFIIVK